MPFVFNTQYRSGRGIGATNYAPPSDQQGRPPMPTPRSGQTGMPSSHATVTMSQLMQQHYEDDEIEDWMEWSFTNNRLDPDNPPYDWGLQPPYNNTNNTYIRENRMILAEIIREFIVNENTNKLNEDELNEDELEEISTVANVAGYVGPLGAGSKIRDYWKQTAKAFGNAKKYRK